MPHLCLCVLHVGASHLQPGRVRCSQASPVRPRQAQPACCGLDKAYENVVIAKRLPRSNPLEHEIFWTIAPKLAGGCGPNLLSGTERATEVIVRLDLISLFEQDSELFARYRVRRDAPT